MEKEWLSLLTLLKTDFSRQICNEKLLQIGKVNPSNNILWRKWQIIGEI